MSRKRRRGHQVTTMINQIRKLNWRNIQRADARGLIFEPASGKLFRKPYGWRLKPRYKIGLQIATYFSQHGPSNVSEPDTQQEVNTR